jgi:hypothetical protein
MDEAVMKVIGVDELGITLGVVRSRADRFL